MNSSQHGHLSETLISSTGGMISKSDSTDHNQQASYNVHTPLNEESQKGTEQRRSDRQFLVTGVVLFVALLVALIGLYLKYRALDDQAAPPPPSNPNDAVQCSHPIYCQGPLLQAVQTAAIFVDSKTFVDMPCLVDPQLILARYKDESVVAGFNLTAFVWRHFAPAGAEVDVVVPVDFVPEPASITNSISNPVLRSFALNIHQIWRNLTRQYNETRFCGPQCVSSLPLNYPFVVPGGRFREFYYWDTYWIIKGLLASNMTTTARHVLENMFEMVEAYRFVPNGARVYYSDRSQPPLLTQMVKEYVDATRNTTFLGIAMPFLVQEHDFWMSSSHAITESQLNASVASSATRLVLNRYYSHTDAPRPESYREDVATRGKAPGRSASDVFSNLATGAETGWDYSSRWFAPNDPTNLSTIIASQIAPVDLNAILLRNEEIIANWSCAGGLLPSASRCVEYIQWAADRQASIASLLTQSSGVIADYNFVTNSHQSSWFASNVVPLSVASIVSNMTTESLRTVLNAIPLSMYGVPASMQQTSQQWDLPNGWAPMQYFTILALEAAAAKLGDSSVQASMTTLLNKWVSMGYCEFQRTGMMFEKYDVVTGTAGGGGEYTVQAGFGWTNGVMLWALTKYSALLNDPQCAL